MSITARPLDGAIINYIAIFLLPMKEWFIGGGSISVNYSMWKLQYAIEKRVIKSYKIYKTVYNVVLAFVFCAIMLILQYVVYGFEGHFMHKWMVFSPGS